MSWHWTAENCFSQLQSIGVELSIGDNGNLVVDAPKDLELTQDDMLRVIRKYKPGLMRILSDKNVGVTHEPHD